MHRAVLVFNPISGRPVRRLKQVEAAAEVLRAAGVEVALMATPAAGAAGDIARQAIASGADTVFACGGDGTVHEVLQGMAGQTQVALGIIPLGTANSLAWDLGIPRIPAAAALAALHSNLRRTAVGRVEYRARDGQCASRYFIMNAGVGMDALLFYRLNALAKRRFGMSAYYVEAFRQWMTARYEQFACEFASDGKPRREHVTQAMAVRVADFGGIVGKLAPGADLWRDEMRLLLFKTARRTDYLRYVLRTALRRPWNVSGVELEYAMRLRCEPLREGSERVYVEADGEMLGHLPAEIEMTGDSVVLLVPQARCESSRTD